MASLLTVKCITVVINSFHMARSTRISPSCYSPPDVLQLSYTYNYIEYHISSVNIANRASTYKYTSSPRELEIPIPQLVPLQSKIGKLKFIKKITILNQHTAAENFAFETLSFYCCRFNSHCHYTNEEYNSC